MPGSYWCLPRELVRCRTLFRGTFGHQGFFFEFWMIDAGWSWGTRICFSYSYETHWSTVKSRIAGVGVFFLLFKVGEDSGNCQSQSRAPRMLRLRGNAVTETDTWCGNLWTSDSFRGPFSSPVKCSMVGECGAMKGTSAVRHTKQSIYVDLCMAWTAPRQVTWTPVLRAHLSQSQDTAPRHQATWVWH